MTECEYCHRSGHVWFQCPKKPDGWKPERLAKKSSAARKDVQDRSGGHRCSGKGSLRRKPIGPESPNDGTVSGKATASGYQAPSDDTKPKRKDTRKGDRHSPGYMAKYMREYRAKLKAQKGER